MAYRGTKESLQQLYTLASPQSGYFTAQQAIRAGYDFPHLSYHVRAGNFERAGHGLYRLPMIPPAEHDDLVRLSLWSRDRSDAPQAVVSHQSALLLHGLSDVLPQRIHMTVPPSFRKLPPSGCVLHKATLSPPDVEMHEGFSVTTPLRTLADAATSHGISDEQLIKAVADALDRGMVRKSKVQRMIGQIPRLGRTLAALEKG